ncbi:MAG TPA: host attachment protein [Stellaceae bacterium]|nr:host attachment protein [Stellaceae bacterium]
MKKEPRIWIVIADGSRARIVAPHDRASAYKTLRAFDSPEARRSAHALGEDLPGRVQESAASGRHAVEPRTDAHMHAEAAFLRELATAIVAADQQDSFDHLLLVAQPRVAAALVDQLPHAVKSKITGQLAKDLTKVPDHQLASHLEAALGLS